MRITSNQIKKLNKGEIFVFGSNLSGVHGRGAAKTALKWGATYGRYYGIQGSTFAIPTKDENIKKTLPIDTIQKYVSAFVIYAKSRPYLTFLVTEIGCELSGLTPEKVAPLFKESIEVDNIHLPKRFWDVITKLH